MFKIPYNLPRKVPWINWKQWNYVRSWLYSSASEQQERGIARVNAWRSREKLPLSIEATASLVELQLNEPKGRSETELRLMFSMAILRFVNGTYVCTHVLVLSLSVAFHFELHFGVAVAAVAAAGAQV